MDLPGLSGRMKDMVRWLLLAVLASAVLAGCGSSAEETAAPGCEFASVRPTYLPWLARNERVPSPASRRVEGYASLTWSSAGRAGWKDSYVDLRTYSGEESGPGKPVSVSLVGVRGGLYELERPGDAVVIWDRGTGPCDALALELSTARKLSRAEVKREIVRIAESLG